MGEQLISASGTQFGMIVNKDGSLNTTSIYKSGIDLFWLGGSIKTSSNVGSGLVGTGFGNQILQIGVFPPAGATFDASLTDMNNKELTSRTVRTSDWVLYTPQIITNGSCWLKLSNSTTGTYTYEIFYR